MVKFLISYIGLSFALTNGLAQKQLQAPAAERVDIMFLSGRDSLLLDRMDSLFASGQDGSVISSASQIGNKFLAAAKLFSFATDLAHKTEGRNHSSLRSEIALYESAIKILQSFAREKDCSSKIYRKEDSYCSTIRGSLNLMLEGYVRSLLKAEKYTMADSIAFEIDLKSTSVYFKELYTDILIRARGLIAARSFTVSNLIENTHYTYFANKLVEIDKALNYYPDSTTAVLKRATDTLRSRIREQLSTYGPAFRLVGGSTGPMENVGVVFPQYLGKTIILEFWATWCTPCVDALPVFQNIREAYRNDTSIVVLLVDTREHSPNAMTEATVREFLQRLKVSVPVYLDRNGEIAERLQVQSLPTRIVIDKLGQIQYRSAGFNGDKRALFEELSVLIDDFVK